MGAVQLLIDAGANPSVTNKFGESPLHFAVRARQNFVRTAALYARAIWYADMITRMEFDSTAAIA